ncbi:unnamed protein product, partial [Nesidiocoris tenuis]
INIQICDIITKRTSHLASGPGQLRLSGEKPTPGTAVYFTLLFTFTSGYEGGRNRYLMSEICGRFDLPTSIRSQSASQTDGDIHILLFECFGYLSNTTQCIYKPQPFILNLFFKFLHKYVVRLFLSPYFIQIIYESIGVKQAGLLQYRNGGSQSKEFQPLIFANVYRFVIAGCRSEHETFKIKPGRAKTVQLLIVTGARGSTPLADYTHEHDWKNDTIHGQGAASIFETKIDGLTALHSTLNIEHVQESFNKERGQPDELTDPLSIPNELNFYLSQAAYSGKAVNGIKTLGPYPTRKMVGIYLFDKIEDVKIWPGSLRNHIEYRPSTATLINSIFTSIFTEYVLQTTQHVPVLRESDPRVPSQHVHLNE